jgi:hypothetical protein
LDDGAERCVELFRRSILKLAFSGYSFPLI